MKRKNINILRLVLKYLPFEKQEPQLTLNWESVKNILQKNAETYSTSEGFSGSSAGYQGGFSGSSGYQGGFNSSGYLSLGDSTGWQGSTGRQGLSGSSGYPGYQSISGANYSANNYYNNYRNDNSNNSHSNEVFSVENRPSEIHYDSNGTFFSVNLPFTIVPGLQEIAPENLETPF